MNAVRLPRLSILATLVAAAVVFVGCDSNDNAIVGACENLRGTYKASVMALQSVDDPDMRETFNDEAELEVAFNRPTFHAQFISPQQDTVSSLGYFQVDREAVPPVVTLTNATLIPGTEPADQQFTCESDGLGFRLENESLGYDLDKNGEYEDTRFTADFELVSR